MKSLITTFICLMIFTGCDPYQQDEYQEQFVVEAYLIANAELPQVRLTTSGSLEEPYDFQDQTVGGARVELRQLGRDSSVVERFQYREIMTGFYNPVSDHRVEPEERYQLHVSTEDGHVIESTTYVPGEITVMKGSGGEYRYQQDRQIEITTTTSSYPGRQSYYIFSVEALDPTLESMTPFYRDLFDEQEDDLATLRLNSSGILNEANFREGEEGTITLPVPWLSVAFTGENDIIINAIDDNMYDFLRTQGAQTGSGTLAPGEIQNITYHIDGGIGIFGAMASNTTRVNILARQE